MVAPSNRNDCQRAQRITQAYQDWGEAVILAEQAERIATQAINVARRARELADKRHTQFGQAFNENV